MTLSSDETRGVVPEPFTIGDPGRAYAETRSGAPSDGASPSDTVCDAFDWAGWSVRAASVRGLSHRQFSEPRQDDFVIRYSRNLDRLVLVVCDGVGSAALSHKAASLAADRLAASVVVAESIDEEYLSEAFHLASDAIVDLARSLSSGHVEDAHDARREMATTSHVVVLEGLSQPGSWSGVSASVGDSTAWQASALQGASFDSFHQINAPAHPDGHQLASTSTSSLPLVDAGSIKIEHVELGAGQLLLVCSDGVSDAFVGGAGQVPMTLGRLWATPPTAINFAAHVGYGRRTQTDDRTCIALWAPA